MIAEATDQLPALDLRILGEEPGLPALTTAAGQFLAESAAVCLEDQGHSPGVRLRVRSFADAEYRLHWSNVTEQMRRTFSDLQAATEDGAYGIAILVIQQLTRFTVVERSRKGTGFDYWLGDPGPLPFQRKARLEVSGILRGTESQVAGRMREKREQTRVSDDTGLPAYVVVVEYSRPIAEVAQR